MKCSISKSYGIFVICKSRLSTCKCYWRIHWDISNIETTQYGLNNDPWVW